MSGLLIRQALTEDTAAVQGLCTQINPHDYVITAWPHWLALPSAANLVADMGGQVVGCIHAEGITAREGWIQALRVHPNAQRRGVGSQLLIAGQTALKSAGIRIVRAAIGAGNLPSRRLVKVAGWRIVEHILRRRSSGRTGPMRRSYHPGAEDAWRLLRKSTVLASRSHTAHYGRVYFSWTREYVQEQVRQHALLISSDSRCLAVLDAASSGETGATWIVGILGGRSALSGLLQDVLAEAAGRGLDVIIDSPARASIQRALSVMNFSPPKSDADFVVVEYPMDSWVNSLAR